MAARHGVFSKLLLAAPMWLTRSKLPAKRSRIWMSIKVGAAFPAFCPDNNSSQNPPLPGMYGNWTPPDHQASKSNTETEQNQSRCSPFRKSPRSALASSSTSRGSWFTSTASHPSRIPLAPSSLRSLSLDANMMFA